MVTVEEALDAYESHISAAEVVRVDVVDAVGCILAEDVSATVDLPPFRQSAMDGYAVSAARLEVATAEDPVALPVGLTVAAGGMDAAPELPSGGCARIFTGGMVPAGADAVVMQEYVVRDGDVARFARPVVAGKNVREQGEELRAGAVVCPAGTRLTPGRVGAVAAAGAATVSVRRRPVVTLLVTGDEVVPAGTELRPGQVYDCNTPMVSAWLARRGVDARTVRLPDDYAETERLIGQALDQSDLVLTTGGVSVGDKDFVIAAAHACGVRDVFWKVRQKPGKPVYFGVSDRAALLGLPGNPAAVFVGLVVHVEHVLRAFEGAGRRVPKYAALADGCRRAGSRDLWLRCSVRADPEGRTMLRPLTAQGSHMLSNLAEATALARIPAGEEPVAAGTSVEWFPV